MDRFVSHFSTRLDVKGRVSIPAPFRAVLARDGFDGLYVHPSLDGPTLDCGGHALLATIDGLMDPLSAAGPDRDTIAMTLLGESDLLKIDGEGRVGLTAALKAHAAIDTDVVFVGIGHKFQVWEPVRFRARLAEARQRATVWRQQLASAGLGASQ